MGKFKIQKTSTVNVGFDYNSSIDGVTIGGTGGDTGITGSQIQVKANLAAVSGNAFIINGRGKSKFLVGNGNVSATCILVNKDVGNLNVGQMSITATYWDGNTISNFYVSKMSNKFVWDFAEPLPNKYLWTGGEAQDSAADPVVGLPIVRIPLA